MVLLELVGCEVSQAAVGPHRVVVVAPSLDDYCGLLARSEPLQREALIAQLAVEALISPVLPRLARVAQRGCDASLRDPFEDSVADELGTVVNA